jgi:hypothetical protein
MAWLEIRYQLTSDCPLILHNGQTADPLNKWAKAIKQISGRRKKTDADYEEMARLEFLAGLYMGPDGPIMPAPNLDSMLLAAAKKTREGQLAKSGVFCATDLLFTYDGPRAADDLWRDERFRHVALVRVGAARISRTRPTFKQWTGVAAFNVETTVVDPERLDDWMVVAGTQIGLGDWRPQHGRFTAQRLNE